MESTGSSTGSQQQLQLRPGFRFHPTDEELVVHYLKKKAASAPLPVAIIAEVNLYKFDPWELPAKASFGEQEWYFFSPRDRKYPNGARPNRAATSGYWKATGTDKPVLTSGGRQKVGVKKALVFYGGRPPKGIKTNWIMHEYRLADNNKSSMKPPGCDIANKKGSLRLDDWVLCRIYKKSNTQRATDHESSGSMNDNMILASVHPKASTTSNYGAAATTTTTNSTGSMLENEQNMFRGMECNADGSISLCAPSKSQLSNLPCSSNFLSIKPNHVLQTTSSSLFWNEEAATGGGGSSSPVSTKRFFTDGGRADDNGSIANLLSQLPQTLHHQLGNLGDGVFRQPPYHHLPDGMNWYS